MTSEGDSDIRSGSPDEDPGNPISHWLDLLEGGDPASQRRAVLAVGEIGEAAKAAIPSLLAILEDKEVGFRPALVKSLTQIGPARGVFPALVGLLEDRDDAVRVEAAAALRQFAEDGWLHALKDLAGRGVRAPDGHLDWGAVVQALLGATNDEVAGVRDCALQALSDSGVDAGANPVLLATLSDSSGAVRSAAAGALTAVDYERGASVPELVKLLDGPTPDSKENVIEALGELGPRALSWPSQVLHEHARELGVGKAESWEAVNKAVAEAILFSRSVADALVPKLLAPDEEVQRLIASILGAGGAELERRTVG